ncbi:hypothetical protein [Paraburkholderia metrosideri]|jgi:hypothetical protein|uniref:DUF3649 domain-containing protein n=1 Tax=Paraburkholderia metrosideri TaxID=580937 RepID=A0ABN7HMY0_9BURK|nr:hypothetical protein [Paraburkholderia metrosideri]CAD6528068.1 hypothetical protein LMG28140_02039 [Paraburkholderia metrosideri]
MTRVATSRRAASSIERDLLMKFVAGVIGGFGLALAASALFARLSPGGLTAASKFHVAMWLVPPLWIALACASFMFRSGARAFGWLALANLAAFALVLLCQRVPF